MKKYRNNSQRGSHHVVLVLVFVLGLVGLLGFLGYNTWQKQSADASGTVAPADTIKVFTANIAGSKTVPELKNRIDTIKPQLVVVTEAQRARQFLSGIDGYRVIQGGTDTSKKGDTAILVENNISILKKGFLEMNKNWEGPHGAPQPARTYPVIRVKTDNVTWNVVGIHFPWKAADSTSGKNFEAWEESWDKVSRYIKAQSKVTIAPGDWNVEKNTLKPKADKEKFHFIEGTKVDHSISKLVQPQSAERVATPDGMHGWIKYTFKAKAN